MSSLCSRHNEACVTRASDTCVYLADGTKVVVCRDNRTTGRAWLEVVPQNEVKATAVAGVRRSGGRSGQ